MLNTEGQYRLVFSSHSNIDIRTVLQGLQKLQFTGKPVFNNSANEYCAGDTFLSSITFMGCSPYIEFEPPENLKPSGVAEFCFIRVSKTSQPVLFHQGQLKNLKTIPRCRQCRKVLPDLQQQAEQFNQSGKFSCKNCDTVLTAGDLDWRKASGVGNIFIEVLNVYLQEAVPTDAFMQQLETITTSPWQYFYTDSNIQTKLLDIR